MKITFNINKEIKSGNKTITLKQIKNWKQRYNRTKKQNVGPITINIISVYTSLPLWVFIFGIDVRMQNSFNHGKKIFIPSRVDDGNRFHSWDVDRQRSTAIGRSWRVDTVVQIEMVFEVVVQFCWCDAKIEGAERWRRGHRWKDGW